MPSSELVARLRKMSVAVHLAADEGPADDLSDGLRLAANEIEERALEVPVLKAREQVMFDLHDALGVQWGDDPYSRIAALKAAEAQVAALREALEIAVLNAKQDCNVNPQFADGLQPIIAFLEAALSSTFGIPQEKAKKDDLARGPSVPTVGHGNLAHRKTGDD